MNDGIKRTAYGYTRVSTEEQVDGASLENQQRIIQDYANRNNIEIVGWYTDGGFSAKTANRPQLKKMLSDIEANRGKIDHVIVYNLSRISRDIPSFVADIIGRMIKCGVTLLSTQETIDDSPEGEMMMYINLALWQRENKNKGRIVKDNMGFLSKEGWWMSQAPIGLKLKRVYVGDTSRGRRYHNTLEKDYTNEIGDKIAFLIRRFSEGDIGEADLVRLSEKLEITNKNGKSFDIKTIHRILTQTAYAGYNSSKRTLDGELVKLYDFDGIVSLDIYNKNQRILNGEKRVLTPVNGSGKKSPRYHCTTKGHGSISISELHESFIEFLDEITPKESTVKLFKEIIKRTASRKLADTNKDLAKCRKEISEIDSKLNKTLDAFLDEKISYEEKERFSKDLRSKRSEYEAAIDKYERVQRLNENTIEYVCNFITTPAKMWKDSPLEARQAFQNILFPNGLHYDILERKFGTEDLSILYSVMNNKKESENDSDSPMVHPIGFEPTTLCSEDRCSNPLSYGCTALYYTTLYHACIDKMLMWWYNLANLAKEAG